MKGCYCNYILKCAVATDYILYYKSLLNFIATTFRDRETTRWKT